MKPGKYSVVELFVNRNIEQIIVPEIQRDYVWGEQQVQNLLNSLLNDFKVKQEASKDDSAISNLPADAKEIYIKQKYASNIGFIYAYYDNEYPDKYFLIDGQQRLTTIYLLQLAIAIKSKRIDEFKQKFFKSGILKIDYKVREASSEFLNRFFENIISGLEVDEIKNQFWYFSEYENDKTIQSIINNFKIIQELLTNTNHIEEFGKYVANMVDFWYFDTGISAQGEELYIYMNSRGELVQSNENLKALLLEKLNEAEKNKWGKKWEDWQDIFWKHKGKNRNADVGFNEFLKWVQIIETIINNKDDFNSLEKIRELEKEVNSNLNIKISLSTIEQYILSFKYLIEDFPQKNQLIKKTYSKYGQVKSIEEVLQLNKWKEGDSDTINKINLFPLLLFIKSNCIDNDCKIKPDADALLIYRFARYFYNILKIETVSKTPFVSYRNTILFANALFKNGKNDLTDILDLIDKNNFLPSETILPEEEKFKLSLFKTPPNNSSREELEQLFWEVEDHKLNNGNISFLLLCLDLQKLNIEDKIKKFNLSEFKSYKVIFDDLFNVSNDLRIRALLTKGDYTFKEGNNPTLGGERRAFGYYDSDWRFIASAKSLNEKLKELILSIYQIQDNQTIEKKLNQIIQGYLKMTNGEEKSWYYDFIKYKEILEYCRYKRICWVSEDEIYLLAQTKATEGNYSELKEFVNNL